MNDRDFVKKLRLIKSNPRFRDVEIESCKKSGIYFMRNYVWSIDEHDRDNPFKQLPVYPYMEYLYSLTDIVPIVLVPKSRQILISWYFCALCLWLVLYGKGKRIGWFSKRGDDADTMLIDRMSHIYRLIPEELKPDIKIYRGGAGKNAKIEVPSNSSKIMAYPAGSDKSRSQTFSHMVKDEIAFMDKARESVTGALPTIKGGGQLFCVSSACKGSFFHDMILRCYKELTDGYPEHYVKMLYDWEGLNKFRGPFPEVEQPMKGVLSYKSKMEDTQCVWIHYTAHPDRSSEEWKDIAKKGYSEGQWKQEMDIDFNVEVGEKVFGIYPLDSQIVEPFDIPKHWIKVRALDFGFSAPTAMLWCAIDPEGDWYFYREYYVRSASIQTHKRNILEACIPDMEDGDVTSDQSYVFSFIDPQAVAKTQSKDGVLYSIQNLYMESDLIEIEGKKFDSSMYLAQSRKKPVDGIYRAQSMFKSGKIKIFSTLNNFLNEINAFVDTKEYLKNNKKPMVKDDHLIDCMIFLMTSIPIINAEENVERPHVGYIKRMIDGRKNKRNDPWLGSEY